MLWSAPSDVFEPPATFFHLQKSFSFMGNNGEFGMPPPEKCWYLDEKLCLLYN